MHLIKVNATDSTNSFAREMFKDNPQLPVTVIVANEQLQGRGQRGTTWKSQPGKNLTFSVIFPKPSISVSRQFLLSAVVSTALVEALKKYNIPKLKVKWPNDIMTANFKIGGILIENVVAEGNLLASIIGIGLNVNQTNFNGLSTAASLKLVTGQYFDLGEVLQVILEKLGEELEILNELHSEKIFQIYKQNLFRIKMPSTFQLPDKTMFTGIIENVSLTGKLIVRVEDDVLKEFDLKEVKLCY